jgi:hypothetical protein
MMLAGEELALFIEDVSTMSILDEELVNALEPQGDTDLCKMLSVLGMTVPAYNRLQENKKDRITLALEIQGDVGNSGALGNTYEADRFVARYLNALRVGDSQISVLSEDLRRDGELRHSACEGCSLRTECFRVFSSITLGEVEIGLYPLARGVVSRLLEGIDIPNSTRNPRGLLRHVLLPLLETLGNTSRTGFNLGINLRPQPPSDLSQLGQTVLGGWSSTQRNQLSYVSWYWSGHQYLKDARPTIEPMLPWFGLPPFVGEAKQTEDSKVVQIFEDKPKRSDGSSVVQTHEGKSKRTEDHLGKPPEHVAQAISSALQSARQRLQVWFDQNKKLTKDAEFRDLLIDVVKLSLDEENTRSPSFAMQEFSTNGQPLTTKNIQIEDMEANPTAGTRAKFSFPRNQSTYDLLSALLDFKHLGQSKSWDFEGGINQQRTYARWLLHNRQSMLQSYNVTKVPTKEVQDFAAVYLVIAHRFSCRTLLPNDTASAVESLVSFVVSEPVAITPMAKKLASDVVSRVSKIREFLFRQLSVPQGGTRNLNFIDSRVIQDAITKGRNTAVLPSIENGALPSEYPEISQLLQSDWSRLSDALKAEHLQLLNILDSLRSMVAHWGIEPEVDCSDRGSLTQCMRIFLQSARDVEKACSDALQSMGRADLQTRIKDLAPAKITSWVTCLEGAVKCEAGGPEGILSLDLGPLLKLQTFAQEIDKAMKQLANDVGSVMAEVVTEQEVQSERTRASAAVKRLSELLESATNFAQEDLKYVR